MTIPDQKTYFNIFCIDKRFDALTTEYFQFIGFTANYYLGTTAGSALPLGYQQYCSEICNCECVHDNMPSCDPLNLDIETFKVIENTNSYNFLILIIIMIMIILYLNYKKNI